MDEHPPIVQELKQLEKKGKIKKDKKIKTDTQTPLFEKSEKKFEILFENAPDPYFIIDNHGKFIDVNKTSEKLLGYSKKQLIGKNIKKLNIIPQSETKKVLKTLDQIRKGKTKHPSEVTLLRKNNEKATVEIKAIPIEVNNKNLIFGIARDITRRKQTEKALEESRDHFKTLFNTVVDPVMILDKKGKFLELTDRVKEYTGYKKEDIIGKNFLNTKLLTKKSKAICIKNLLKRMSGIDVKPYEVEALTKDGKKILFEVNAEQITYQGKPADMVVFRDISERKEAEKKIRQSEKTYRNLFTNAQIGLFRIDFKKGEILECNDQMAKMLGYKKRRELLKTNFHSKYKDINKKNEMIEIVEKNNEIKNFEARFYRKDGTIFWGKYSARYYKEKGWLEGVFEDITKEKIAEIKNKKHLNNLKYLSKSALELLELPKNKNIYSFIAEKIYGLVDNGIVIVNELKKKDTLYNQAILGLKEKKHGQVNHFIEKNNLDKEIKGITDKEKQVLLSGNLIRVEGGLYQLFFKKIPKVKCLLLEKVLGIKNIYSIGLKKEKSLFGNVVIIELEETSFNKDTIETVVNQSSMVIKQREDEKTLKSTQKELRNLNSKLEEKVKKRTQRIENLLKQKDSFVNQLGHDLKNPLTPLVNLLPILEKKEKNPESKELFNVLTRNVEHMKNLVDKTIKLAQLNAPGEKFNFEKINLSEEIENILNKNKFLCKKKNIELESKIGQDITVNADKIQLTELFDNLINNAVKYTDKKSGKITIKTSRQNEDYVEISISDEGIGMTKKQIKYAFDEFYKADHSRHDFDSSGLGLPICKKIIERHGGKIWIESPGKKKGTTIKFTLPLIKK
ncbi:MAG: PAS domain S-box protein [Candidatus Thermoplasmatota archaeon]